MYAFLAEDQLSKTKNWESHLRFLTVKCVLVSCFPFEKQRKTKWQSPCYIGCPIYFSILLTFETVFHLVIDIYYISFMKTRRNILRYRRLDYKKQLIKLLYLICNLMSITKRAWKSVRSNKETKTPIEWSFLLNTPLLVIFAST